MAGRTRLVHSLVLSLSKERGFGSWFDKLTMSVNVQPSRSHQSRPHRPDAVTATLIVPLDAALGSTMTACVPVEGSVTAGSVKLAADEAIDASIVLSELSTLIVTAPIVFPVTWTTTR